jgi:hypothetical protein
MTLNEYQPKAVATLNPELTLLERLGTCGMGLACEALELSTWLFPKGNEYKFLAAPHCKDRELEIAKELGDLTWYSAGIAGALDLSLAEICGEPSGRTNTSAITFVNALSADNSKIQYSFYRLCEKVEVVAGLLKWVVYHGHDLTEEYSKKIEKALRSIIHEVQCLAASACSMKLSAVLEMNIEKLRKRYPSGVFTTKDSVERTE